MSRNKVITIIVFTIVSFFVFRHCVTAGVSMVATISSSILYPILRIQHAIIIPMVKRFEERAAIYELKNKVQQLYTRNQELYAENIALKSLYLYANEIKELQDFNCRYALKRGCIVQVLARHFSCANQFFLVNAGASQGIKKDMVALYSNNIVGKVVEVYPWYCKVCLVTDSDCKIAASSYMDVGDGKSIGYQKGASGIHEGINDPTSTTMRYVSHLESINVGDMVLSSGEGLIFPKGFALGRITHAHKGELFYDVTVKPILDLESLQYCTLIAKEDIER